MIGDDLDLSWMRDAPIEESRDYLVALPGVGRKTAACVLLFAYGLREVPVDTHVSRVGGRLGSCPPRRRSRSCTTRCCGSLHPAPSSSCTSTCCATAGGPATPSDRRARAATCAGCARRRSCSCDRDTHRARDLRRVPRRRPRRRAAPRGAARGRVRGLGRRHRRLGRVRPRRDPLDLGLPGPDRRVPRLGPLGPAARQPARGHRVEHRQALPRRTAGGGRHGVPGPGEPFAAPAGEYVVKPSVSAGSRDTARFAPGEEERAAALVERIHATGRTAMVQPYVHAVDHEGETALLFFDGVLSHAIRKGALLTPGADPARRRLRCRRTSRAREPAHDERALAERVVVMCASASAISPTRASTSFAATTDPSCSSSSSQSRRCSSSRATAPQSASRRRCDHAWADARRSRLRTYIAASAAWAAAASGTPRPRDATPTDAGAPATASSASTRSRTVTAVARSHSRRSTANSSPPSRATTSLGRTALLSAIAARMSSSSPAPCPSRSLTALSPSRSATSTAAGDP